MIEEFIQAVPRFTYQSKRFIIVNVVCSKMFHRECWDCVWKQHIKACCFEEQFTLFNQCICQNLHLNLNMLMNWINYNKRHCNNNWPKIQIVKMEYSCFPRTISQISLLLLEASIDTNMPLLVVNSVKLCPDLFS